MNRCILSKFYIKPQRHILCAGLRAVVSYRNSTSNHNSPLARVASTPLYLIEILHQTTTGLPANYIFIKLYLIEILHQTTTHWVSVWAGPELYLIEILHQTTTLILELQLLSRCILSKFYIKPQLRRMLKSTTHCCILSKFYIKPQLSGSPPKGMPCCILSKFYIKPQPKPYQ